MDSVKMKTPLRLSFRNGLAKGKLCYAKKSGKGSGCFKLVPKEKEAKKPAVKKVVKKVKAVAVAVPVEEHMEEIYDIEDMEEDIEEDIVYDFCHNSSFEEPDMF